MQTPSLDEESQKLFINQVLRYVRNKGIKITTKTDSYGNVYVTKGTAGLYPCVVSHVDTVHSYNPDLKILNCGDLVFGFDSTTGKQHGIGADPKNGVYFAIEMLLRLDHVKVVFFQDEESGCLGSTSADMQFFKDCSFVVQLDRRSFTTDIIEHTNGVRLLS